MSDLDREEICPDCQASPDVNNARITNIMKDPGTDEFYRVVTWHTQECPAYTVDQIMMEEGVRRAKEESEWGKKEFPAAYERLIRAVMKGKFDETVQPFVVALVELVEAQGEDLGRVVLPERWVEILNRNFPPQGGTPSA
jgi:hypothetical protein